MINSVLYIKKVLLPSIAIFQS